MSAIISLQIFYKGFKMKKKILFTILTASFLAGCGENLKELPKEITENKKFTQCDKILNEFLDYKGWNWSKFLEVSKTQRENGESLLQRRSLASIDSHREVQYEICFYNLEDESKPEAVLEILKENYKRLCCNKALIY